LSVTPWAHRRGSTKIEVLFERFLNTERREPPDIDVDSNMSGARKLFNISTRVMAAAAPR